MEDSFKSRKILVAAIDIGTTFSGYAYQFKEDYEKERSREILANISWEGDEQRSQKTVTAILFNEKGEFDSFGYLAEGNYSEKALRETQKDCYFFKHFKMKLHDKKIDRNITVDDANGKPMRAMTVFGESIRYLKGHLLNQLKTRGTHVDNDDIHWVLTVPAIWSDSAKQFMREAANFAGINSEQLTIALEPEAASLYCQVTTEDPVTQKKVQDDFNIAKAGVQFMVIDLGGGTADITVHRREGNGTLTELHQPSGGHFGGSRVDGAFENLLKSLVGSTVYTKFCTKYAYDYLKLLLDFERSKRTFSPERKEIVVTIPIKLEECYKEETQEDVAEGIKNSPYNGKVEWLKDKIIIPSNMMIDFFSICADNLVKHVHSLLEDPAVQGTGLFLMVGGFAESKFMQMRVKDNFPQVKLIIPSETGLAVVKGAVLYGQNPTIFSSRIARYTYGINISPEFDNRIHPKSHFVQVGTVSRCRDVFKVYITKGELMKRGVPKTGTHISLKPDQHEMVLKVFVSSREDPKFVDDNECECAGSLVVKLPKTGDKVKVEVRMMFGGTELCVEAQELGANERFNAYFDFL